MNDALTWPSELLATADHRLVRAGRHFLIPAFFHTISTLAAQGRDFTVVIRTFGSDISDVVEAINAFAEGKHLVGPRVPEVAISPSDVWEGIAIATQYNAAYPSPCYNIACLLCDSLSSSSLSFNTVYFSLQPR